MADILQILQEGIVWLWTNLIVGLIFAIFILIIGYVVAKVVKWIVIKGLKRVRVDSYFRGTGLLESLRNVGFAGIPEILGLLVFWFIFLFFVALALTYLQFEQVGAFVTLIIEYLPRIMGAVLIVLGGLWMGTWAAARVKEPSEEADLPITTETVGSIVKWVIVFITVVLALGLLGVDTTILVTTFTILIAAIAVALAISFGLGGKETAANISAYAAVKTLIRVGDAVSIDKHEGTVLLVGRYAAVIKTERGDRISIPNTTVMNSEIIKRAP